MIKIERPNTIEEAKTLAKRIKFANDGLKNNLSVVEEYIDDALSSLSDGGHIDFYLKEAEKYLAKSEKYKVELIETKEINAYPLALRRALDVNYFEQGVTYYRLQKRLNAVKGAIAAATKQ